MDPTEHGHIPYVIILVRVLEDWKKEVQFLRHGVLNASSKADCSF
jgi:hypothetical protein